MENDYEGLGVIEKDVMKVDASAAGALISSPLWASWLSGINALLTFVSLVLGIGFLLYRWEIAARSKDGEVARRGFWPWLKLGLVAIVMAVVGWFLRMAVKGAV